MVSIILETQPLAGMVPFCLVMRLMVRVLVSGICVRVIAPRLRMRALGSACAVINGSERTAN